MIELWLVEFLKGIGRLFLHPLFYGLFGMAVFLGYLRVKRERKVFHTRLHDGFYELRSLLPMGVILGLVLSIITISSGVVIPFGTIALIGVITIILSLTFSLRWLSPSYIIGFSMFGIIFLSTLSSESSFLQGLIEDLKNTSLTAVVVLLALLVISEGLLVLKNGSKGTSPHIEQSKRGLPVGSHLTRRLWMVPVFLVLPGEVLQTQFQWWPLFSVNDGQYALTLVPFAIGFQNKTLGTLPSDGIRFIGKRIIAHGLVIAALAVGSIWYPILAIVAASLALIGRELISIHHRLTDDSMPFFFSRKDHGLMILGIIPKTPAEKMGLQVGEIVTKVNSIPVKSEGGFYEALQKNRAYCKLEIVDTNGEVRFVQRALYDGEHHELGILFVHDQKKWENKAV
ncbi:PDZ domain-containing protein [Cytobacillus suaedae]|nr:PDZ domain-containing protein [Cytobacillus suaedae]